MSIEKKEQPKNNSEQPQKQHLMLYPRYFSYIGALPLLVFIILVSNYFSINNQVNSLYSESMVLKTETEKFKTKVDDLETKKQSIRDSMIKERAKLSPEESVKRSISIQNIEKTNNPVLDAAKNQLTEKKLAWSQSIEKLNNANNTLKRLIISLSLLLSWVILSSLLYYSLRDYKPTLLLTLGVGVSALALMISQLFPVSIL